MKTTLKGQPVLTADTAAIACWPSVKRSEVVGLLDQQHGWRRVKRLADGDLPDDEDCCFCIGLLKPGATRRSKENVKRIHMLVVDEKGEPLPIDGLARLPQGVNTSFGNYKVRIAAENPGATLSAEDFERLVALGRLQS